MAFNLIKQYSSLLEIMHLSDNDRKISLKRIFNRDISENLSFMFNQKNIHPITKDDGISAMDTLYHHLTTEEVEFTAGDSKYKKRIFEKDRSMRLHWVKYLTNNTTLENIFVFSVEERDHFKRKDVIRTYIYDKDQLYVIVLEPQRNSTSYYLLTAYYLNKEYAPKQMEKKIKNKLSVLY